jgi:hypothetical protein
MEMEGLAQQLQVQLGLLAQHGRQRDVAAVTGVMQEEDSKLQVQEGKGMHSNFNQQSDDLLQTQLQQQTDAGEQHFCDLLQQDEECHPPMQSHRQMPGVDAYTGQVEQLQPQQQQQVTSNDMLPQQQLDNIVLQQQECQEAAGSEQWQTLADHQPTSAEEQQQSAVVQHLLSAVQGQLKQQEEQLQQERCQFEAAVLRKDQLLCDQEQQLVALEDTNAMLQSQLLQLQQQCQHLKAELEEVS